MCAVPGLYPVFSWPHSSKLIQSKWLEDRFYFIFYAFDQPDPSNHFGRVLLLRKKGRLSTTGSMTFLAHAIRRCSASSCRDLSLQKANERVRGNATLIGSSWRLGNAELCRSSLPFVHLVVFSPALAIGGAEQGGEVSQQKLSGKDISCMNPGHWVLRLSLAQARP
jgi:hypothetical protein